MNLNTVVTKKQSTPKFPKKEHFLPNDTHAYVTDVLRCAFLPYYRRFATFHWRLGPEFSLSGNVTKIKFNLKRTASEIIYVKHESWVVCTSLMTWSLKNVVLLKREFCACHLLT